MRTVFRRACAVAVVLALAGCATTGVNKAKMAEGYYFKGLSYLKEKNYPLASVEFQRSIQADSAYKLSYFGLGLINDYQEKYDDAVRYYEKAIDLDSDFSDARNNLGVVLFKQKKYKEAVKSFNKALANKLYTTPYLPYLNLGDLYMEERDYTKAVDAYRESKRYMPDVDLIIFKLGMALFEAGRLKEAIMEFQEGVALNQKNAGMRYSLALALLKDGNRQAAATEFKKVVEIDPKSALAEKARDYLKTLR